MGAGCSVLGMGDSPVGVRTVTPMSRSGHSFQHGLVAGDSRAAFYPPTVLLRLALVSLLLTAACGSPLPAPGAPATVDVAGRYRGTVDRPAPLTVVVTLAGGPEALSGTLDLPDRGLRDLPLANVGVDGATVRFTVPDLPGDASFAGTLAADGSALGGTFVQDGRRDPLVLLRAA